MNQAGFQQQKILLKEIIPGLFNPQSIQSDNQPTECLGTCVTSHVRLCNLWIRSLVFSSTGFSRARIRGLLLSSRSSDSRNRIRIPVLCTVGGFAEGVTCRSLGCLTFFLKSPNKYKTWSKVFSAAWFQSSWK